MDTQTLETNLIYSHSKLVELFKRYTYEKTPRWLERRSMDRKVKDSILISAKDPLSIHGELRKIAWLRKPL